MAKWIEENLKCIAFGIYFIVGFMFLGVIASCEDNTEPTGHVNEFSIIDIDSCEYLVLIRPNSYYGVMAHKGNCKYCAERRKKELEKLER